MISILILLFVIFAFYVYNIRKTQNGLKFERIEILQGFLKIYQEYGHRSLERSFNLWNVTKNSFLLTNYANTPESIKIMQDIDRIFDANMKTYNWKR